MNIRQIEVFRAVMETGSVTGAAARLQRSQPAISKHLGLLEEDVGFALFSRTGNRLKPTEEAMRLFEQVELTYRGVEHLARFASDLRGSRQRELSVAAMPLLARAWLPDVVTTFIGRHDHVSMSLPVRSSRWILHSVAVGRADIGVGLSFGDEAGVVQKQVMKLPLVCVFPPEHRMAAEDVVTPEALSGETLISLSNFDRWRLTVERTLDSCNVRPARRIDSFTTYVACELASRAAGVAIVDSLTARDYAGSGLIWRPFRPKLDFDICLMWSRHRRRSGLVQDLLDELAACARRTQADIDNWLSAGPVRD